MGSVTVKGDKIQVTFDGRPVGLAPVTICNVPRGDYVVEGADPLGNEVSRPVTIDENNEATVDLNAGVIRDAQAAPDASAKRGGPFRLPRTSKILTGVSAAALGVGLVFGALELNTHSDYESAPANQATLDALAAKGSRDARIANVGFALCGASLLAAAVVALPAFLASERPSSQQAAPLTVSAVPTRGGAMAGFWMRF